MKVYGIAFAVVIAAATASPPAMAQSTSFVEGAAAGFVPLEQATTLEALAEAAVNVLGTNSTNSTNGTDAR